MNNNELKKINEKEITNKKDSLKNTANEKENITNNKQIKTPEEEKRNFKGIWLPKNIYLNENLNWIEKILLAEIDSLDNGRGCFASNKYFSEFLKVTERSVTTAISNLKKLGFIEQSSFNGKTRKLKRLEKNYSLRLEENFYSAPKKTSRQTRSLLLPSNNSINKKIITKNNNKKDKSFLEKDNSFSNQNLKSFHDFSFKENDLELESEKTKEEREYDEKALNFEDNEAGEKNETNREDLRKEVEETKETKEENKENSTNQEQTNTQTPNSNHLRKQIFGFGTMLLNKTGQTDQESRKIIGRWLKTNRETEVFEFIKQAITENIIEPVSWITKQLEKQNVSFQEQKKKEIQNKYNGRKEELEEEYRRTHNGEYNETKITNCFYSETEDDKLTNNSLINNDTIILTENNNPINNNPLNSLNNDTINNNIASNNPTNSNNSINNNPTPGSIAYKNKILSKILKPIFHYYGMVYDNEIVTSFCKTLSFYEYDMLKETRDELITEYKTFPKLANWIEKLKDKRTKQNKYAVMPKELKETINHNDNNNKNWLYVKKRIIEDMGINIFNCWFRDISLIEEKQNKVLLSANNSFVSDYIKRNYLNGTKTKLSSGDTIWLRRGLKEYWQEISPEIETIEIKPINEIKLTVGIGQDKPIVNENPAENPSITADNKNPTADKEDKNPSTTEGVKHD